MYFQPLNRYIEKLTFKQETLRDVSNIVQEGMHGTSVDLKDAYYHISMVKWQRKYLRVKINLIYHSKLG